MRSLGRDEVLEEALPSLPRTLFPRSRIEVEKRRSRRRLVDPSMLRELRILPPESCAALRRLISRDFKQFVDIHIDAHLCPYLVSKCREAGPRILYSITRLGNGVELYSECIDLEILASIVFGDLLQFMEFGRGFRDAARFNYMYVGSDLLRNEVLETLEDLVENPPNIDLGGSRLVDFVHELARLGNEVSEVIVSIPCITREFVDEVLPVLNSLARNGARIYVLTRSPWEAEDVCNATVSRYAKLLMDLMLDLYEGMKLCFSSVSETTIVVNRCVVATTYSISYRGSSSIIVVRDPIYGQNTAVTQLRQCLCVSTLVHEDRAPWLSIR